ncbi:uncharacterized protein [Halyomorpha halys]|uniref:uncharacterized protein n=1 Tax=Halyomorpha halys TaxID=286706 RepID=UPI0034D174AE
MIKIWELPSTEEMAVKYFQNFGIISSTKVCDNGHDMSIYGMKQWRCRSVHCAQRISIRKGTWFSGSKLPFTTTLRFIYCWSQNLTSIKWGKQQLDLSMKTVVDWNNFLREMCARSILSKGKKKIGGPEKTVEIGESLFSKSKIQNSRLLSEQWILGGICRETDECFVVAVSDREASTLLQEIENNIEEESTIVSNCWKGYKAELRDANFEHFKVNHSYNFIDPYSDEHTQHIERLWRSAKWQNKKHERFVQQHLDSYLYEFMWRHLHKEEDPFIAILNDIRDFSPLK